MDALWSNMTPPDWIALGLVALVPVLMVVAIHLIRAELHRARQQGPVISSGAAEPPLHLKTTKAQREQWRMGKQRHPRAIVDLTDDIETLLKRIRAGH
jgi:hypothetical protein